MTNQITIKLKLKMSNKVYNQYNINQLKLYNV